MPAPTTKPAGNLSLDRIAGMLTLQERLLEAKTIEQVQYLLVNDTHYLFPAKRLILFSQGKIIAHSSLSDTSQETPYTAWVKKVFEFIDDHFLLTTDSEQAIKRKEKNRSRLVQRIVNEAIKKMDDHRFEGEDLAFSIDQPQKIYTLTDRQLPNTLNIRQDWETHWPHYAAILPLCDHQEHLGYLVFLRDKPWQIEAEQKLLIHWAQITAVVLRNHTRKNPLKQLIPHWRVLFPLTLFASVMACLFLPVRLSVLAEAEVIASAKSLVRAPINGIIDTLHVAPNSLVKKGDRLLTFDQSELQAQLERAKQALAVSQAELKRTHQQALSLRKARFEMPVLASEVDQAQADVDFYTQELSRVTVLAPQDGIAVVTNPDDWQGRSVQLGEHLLDVVDDIGQGVELWLPSADNIPLPPNAPVSVFLHVDPSHVHHAAITHVSYRAELAPTGELAFRARALLDDHSQVRVGWRGTAKVSGETVSLGYYLFRRPWMMIRTYLGW